MYSAVWMSTDKNAAAMREGGGDVCSEPPARAVFGGFHQPLRQADAPENRSVE